ncbi:DUF2610 domain-containing protein [Rickettsia endosymbiont of Cardiosporidium cionae]|uniref:DUF2610 domain-containing protein n=1 Tax=Rickettsia endosymbiont of Cardiosporidium cionae TaxID=2777155 RepID=UPI0018956605|nr:DUF2610 domain-containing protein [Rickettsia endosymbiont of Cardiosporidium cionae]KAF8818415.1 hypothetical protein IHI24_000505 [Rickettsia endosymbiont of Cardiosporidium cionae]
MKKFTISCDFNGQTLPFSVYIGRPEANHHPLHFQADWLSKQRGGTIPANVMDAISELQEMSTKNDVLLEDLCVYAIDQSELEEEEEEEDNT